MINAADARQQQEMVNSMRSNRPMGVSLETGDLCLDGGRFVSSAGSTDTVPNSNVVVAKPGTKLAVETDDFGATDLTCDEHGRLVRTQEAPDGTVRNAGLVVAKQGTKLAVEPDASGEADASEAAELVQTQQAQDNTVQNAVLIVVKQGTKISA